MQRGEMSCSALHCGASPCGRPVRFVLADRAEVPLECPNRVELPDPTWQLFRLMAGVDTYVTQRASAIVGRHPVGGALGNVYELAVAGELVLLETVVRPQLRIGKFVGEPEEPPGPGPGPGPPPQRTTWIKIKVVDDASGDPIRGVKVFVREPDGDEHEHATRADGVVELQEIDPGTCRARSELEGARLEDTLAFVSMGEQAGGGGDDAEGGEAAEGNQESTSESSTGGQTPARGTRIARIEEHQVQNGETFESVASAAGMTWQQLSEFGWGTSAEDEVNRRLREDIGARSPNGGATTFDGTEEPGVIYVPSEWSQDGLATEREHTVRVKSLRYAPGMIECVCIPGLTFEFDKSFIRPSVVDHMAPVDAALRRHPEAKLIIWGHTDRVGNDQYNKDLSDRRAKSTYAFITDQPDVWEELYNEENWGLKSVQTVLLDLGHDPGGIDGQMGPETRGAMRSFKGLPEGASVQNDAAFRRELFEKYMTGKHDVRVSDGQFAPPKFMGCGEFNPFVEPNEHELANRRPGNEPNRRVVLYLFNRPPSDVPCEIHNLAPCRAEIDRNPDQRNDRSPNPAFRCAFYDGIARECSCEQGGGDTATNGLIFMQIFERSGVEKMGGRSYAIVSDNDESVRFEGTLDGDGQCRHEDVPPDDYTLTVDGFSQDCPALVLDPNETTPQIRFLQE